MVANVFAFGYLMIRFQQHCATGLLLIEWLRLRKTGWNRLRSLQKILLQSHIALSKLLVFLKNQQL